MVRKERFNSHDRVISRLVEGWLTQIRKRMPKGSTVSVTVQSKPKYGFSASFRLICEGEVLSSESRGQNAVEAVIKAGRALCEHLPATSDFTERRRAS